MREEKPGPLKHLNGQMILGKEAFIEKTIGLLKGERISQEIAERKKVKKLPTAEDIIKVVAREFALNEEELKKNGGWDNTAKKAAIYLVKRYSGLSNQQIGHIFGGMHYTAVSKSSARFEREVEKNEQLRSLIRSLMPNVKT